MSVISKSILLVDDDQEIRELLQTYLSRAGFQVRGVSDGAGFRQAMNEAPCDLVILDVMLPGRSGLDVLAALRADEATRALPVLMLTARGQGRDRAEAERIGASRFMTKPFSNSEMLATVRELASA